MKMTYEEAKRCITGPCKDCKYDNQDEFDCRGTALEMAETAINYLLVGEKLKSQMEGKNR